MSVIDGLLFSFLGYAVCVKANEFKLKSAKEYFDFLFPEKLSALLHFICMAFLSVSFCIMIAGCGTLFNEQFSVRPVIGSLFSLVICYKIIKNNMCGLQLFNAIVTPLMFLGTVVLCCAVMFSRHDVNFAGLSAGSPTKATFSAALYLSYNFVSAAAVLAPCASSLAESKRRAGIGGIVGGILVAVPLVLLSTLLSLYPAFHGEQLPFFALVCDMNPKLKLICASLLYCAMLTTAASSGVSALAHVKPGATGKCTAALCTVAFALSFVPFDVLVKTMYTIFGICGLILIPAIVKSVSSKR